MKTRIVDSKEETVKVRTINTVSTMILVWNQLVAEANDTVLGKKRDDAKLKERDMWRLCIKRGKLNSHVEFVESISKVGSSV
jgi:hypothetical protein